MSRVVKVESWERADAMLRVKGEAEIAVARIEAELTAKCTALKERAVADSAQHQAMIAEADAMLEAFFRGQGVKSKRLNFGWLKLRPSRAVKLLRSPADVIEALGTGFKRFLRIEPQIDKRAILDANPEDLKQLRRFLAIEERETFSAKPDREAIERLSGGAAAA